MSGLSTRDVAGIIGVPESRVRYWAQIGLVGPTYKPPDSDGTLQRPTYAFTDLVAARAARELTERGIPARRVREAILALRAQLPALDRPLLHLRVLSDGERLVVTGDQPFEPLTGQRVMDFALDELSTAVARLDGERSAGDGVPRPIAPDATRREASGRAGPPTTALAWFEEGLTRARAGAHDAAMDAYRRALDLDEHLGPAHANLGVLQAAAGKGEEATLQLDSALRADPSSVEARAARAELYERAGLDAEALACWAQLLPVAPKRAEPAVQRLAAVIVRRRKPAL